MLLRCVCGGIIIVAHDNDKRCRAVPYQVGVTMRYVCTYTYEKGDPDDTASPRRNPRARRRALG